MQTLQYPNASPEFYATMIARHLPPGHALDLSEGSNLSRLLRVLGATFAHVHNRAVALALEANPLGITETLVAREQEAGLPDSCSVLAPTFAQRKARVIQQWRAGGGQSKQWFIDYAALFGFVITITEYLGVAGHEYEWLVTIDDSGGVREFKAGEGRAGDALRDWGSDFLECLIRRVAPAHTVVLFAYV